MSSSATCIQAGILWSYSTEKGNYNEQEVLTAALQVDKKKAETFWFGKKTNGALLQNEKGCGLRQAFYSQNPAVLELGNTPWIYRIIET